MTDLTFVTDCCPRCDRLNRPKTATRLDGEEVNTRYECDCGNIWSTSWDSGLAERHDEEMRRIVQGDHRYVLTDDFWQENT